MSADDKLTLSRLPGSAIYPALPRYEVLLNGVPIGYVYQWMYTRESGKLPSGAVFRRWSSRGWQSADVIDKILAQDMPTRTEAICSVLAADYDTGLYEQRARATKLAYSKGR